MKICAYKISLFQVAKMVAINVDEHLYKVGFKRANVIWRIASFLPSVLPHAQGMAKAYV